MQVHDSWSVSIGRWMGVPIRLHFCLLLFFILIYAVGWNFAQLPTAMGGISSGTALVTVLAFLVAIILHELAHIFAAVNLGGSVNKLVLAPWGGQSEFLLPNSARAQAVVCIAGVFANFMLFLLLASALVLRGHAPLWELINPLRPHAMTGEIEISILRIFCWVNFQIAFVNCLPAYPFDGSHLLRLFIWGNNKHVGRHRLETSVMAIAHMVAVSLFVLALFAYTSDYKVGPLQPVWALLASAGLILIFASRQEFFRRTSVGDQVAHPAATKPSDDDMIDFEAVYDEDSDIFEFEQDPNDTISQWLRQKQEERQLVEYEIEKEDEVRADGILEKLHQSGKDSLTDEERSVLHRVSDRYRRRRRQLPS